MAFTYLHFYKEFLRMVMSEYDINVQLKETSMGKIFPEVRIEEKEVYFNPQLLSLVILYNLSLRYREVSNEPVVLYTLYNIYMAKDDYDHAGMILHDLNVTLSKVEESTRDCDKQQVEDAANMQMIFILLHETYHILLGQLPKVKKQFLTGASQRVKDLRDMLPNGSEEEVIKEMKSLIPQSLPTEVREQLEKELVDKMFKGFSEIYDYDRYLNDEENGMLEELACDLQAWNLILQQLKGGGCPEEYILYVNAWVFMSLNIMDYDKFLNTLYKDSCARKELVNPRTAVLRHSFLRSYIDTYYAKCSEYDFADFKRISEEMEDNGRANLIANLFNHIHDIKALKASPFRLPDLEMRKKMNKEIAKMDERIICLVRQGEFPL